MALGVGLIGTIGAAMAFSPLLATCAFATTVGLFPVALGLIALEFALLHKRWDHSIKVEEHVENYLYDRQQKLGSDEHSQDIADHVNKGNLCRKWGAAFDWSAFAFGAGILAASVMFPTLSIPLGIYAATIAWDIGSIGLKWLCNYREKQHLKSLEEDHGILHKHHEEKPELKAPEKPEKKCPVRMGAGLSLAM